MVFSDSDSPKLCSNVADVSGGIDTIDTSDVGTTDVAVLVGTSDVVGLRTVLVGTSDVVGLRTVLVGTSDAVGAATSDVAVLVVIT